MEEEKKGRVEVGRKKGGRKKESTPKETVKMNRPFGLCVGKIRRFYGLGFSLD